MPRDPILEAEGAVIAAAIADTAFADELLDFSEALFVHQGPLTIRQAMKAIQDAGEPMTAAALTTHSPEVEGALGELPDPDRAQLAILQKRRLQRAMVDLGRRITAGIASPEDTLDAALEEIGLLLKGGGDDARQIGDLAEEVLAAKRPEQGVFGIGIETLDYALGSVQRGDYVLLGARPSSGKSALALQMAVHSAQRGEGALFFSLEQSGFELSQRALSQLAGVPYSQVVGSAGKGGELKAAEAKLRALPLWLQDRGNISVGELKAEARRHQRKHGLSLVVVDYLQLLRPSGDKRFEHREREVAETSRALKILGKELDVMVLVLSQLNRSIEMRHDKRPLLSDLRESGSLEQDADMVMFLHRPAQYDRDADEDKAEMVVAKARNGPTGHFDLRWDGPRMRFGDDIPF